MLRFRKDFRAPSIVRKSVEKCNVWRIPLYITHSGSARAYDSARHDAVWNAMPRRSAPLSTTTTQLRDIWSSDLIFVAWELAHTPHHALDPGTPRLQRQPTSLLVVHRRLGSGRTRTVDERRLWSVHGRVRPPDSHLGDLPRQTPSTSTPLWKSCVALPMVRRPEICTWADVQRRHP